MKANFFIKAITLIITLIASNSIYASQIVGISLKPPGAPFSFHVNSNFDVSVSFEPKITIPIIGLEIGLTFTQSLIDKVHEKGTVEIQTPALASNNTKTITKIKEKIIIKKEDLIVVLLDRSKPINSQCKIFTIKDGSTDLNITTDGVTRLNIKHNSVTIDITNVYAIQINFEGKTTLEKSKESNECNHFINQMKKKGYDIVYKTNKIISSDIEILINKVTINKGYSYNVLSFIENSRNYDMDVSLFRNSKKMNNITPIKTDGLCQFEFITHEKRSTIDILVDINMLIKNDFSRARCWIMVFQKKR